ncbi:MAG: response regulator [Bacteroidales bacterium]|nr:response regulator [Bacteroidales bacterium]MDD4602379.1 response regulator [Bacteroidales bacterium]
MKQISVYIVEDELLISASLKSQLKGYGYEILGSSTRGELCVEEITELSRQGREPEIILMDIHLRGELDGIDTAKKINDKFNSAIIFLTGQSSKEVYERSFKIKPFGYLLKPIDMEQTKMTIEIAAYQRNLEIENHHYQKKLEDLLEKRSIENQELMDMYQMIIDNSFMGLTILQNGRFVFANRRAAEIFNCKLDELLSLSYKDIIEFVYPDDINKIQEDQKCRIRILTKKQDIKWVEMFKKAVHFKGQKAYHHTFLDITEHQKRLSEMESFFNQ